MYSHDQCYSIYTYIYIHTYIHIHMSYIHIYIYSLFDIYIYIYRCNVPSRPVLLPRQPLLDMRSNHRANTPEIRRPDFVRNVSDVLESVGVPSRYSQCVWSSGRRVVPLWWMRHVWWTGLLYSFYGNGTLVRVWTVGLHWVRGAVLEVFQDFLVVFSKNKWVFPIFRAFFPGMGHSFECDLWGCTEYEVLSLQFYKKKIVFSNFF